MAKRTSLEREVEAAFEAAYKATGNWTAAYNMVLDRVGGKYDPETKKGPLYVTDKRQAVGDVLRKIQKRIMRRLKDPFTLAVDDAMKSLRRDGAVRVGQEAYDEFEEVNKGDTEDADGPNLYVEFNDNGHYQSWRINYPSYYQGHGGPVATVSLPTDWDSIESEIGETLAQAEIFEE